MCVRARVCTRVCVARDAGEARWACPRTHAGTHGLTPSYYYCTLHRPLQAVYLESEPFSLQNNLLTPTQKLKRMEARERYSAIIDELYQKLEQKRAVEAAKAERLAKL